MKIKEEEVMTDIPEDEIKEEIYTEDVQSWLVEKVEAKEARKNND